MEVGKEVEEKKFRVSSERQRRNGMERMDCKGGEKSGFWLFEAEATRTQERFKGFWFFEAFRGFLFWFFALFDWRSKLYR